MALLKAELIKTKKSVDDIWKEGLKKFKSDISYFGSN